MHSRDQDSLLRANQAQEEDANRVPIRARTREPHHPSSSAAGGRSSNRNADPFLYGSLASKSFTEILLKKSLPDDEEEEEEDDDGGGDYEHVYGELNDWISLDTSHNGSHTVDPFNLFQWS
jgi:hypothetical protein